MHPIFKGTEIIQYLAVFFGSLNIITSGLAYGWPSCSLPKLTNPSDKHVNVHLTTSEGSWAAVGPLLGAIVGSPLAGTTLDHVGRRRMILFTFFPYFVSFLSIAFATTPFMLIFGRMVSGVADGCIFTSLPVYIGEIASPKIRGFLGSSIPVCLIGGVVIINIIGVLFTITDTALICLIFPTICFTGMLFMPESPYYLIMKNRLREARSSLENLRGKEDVEEELERISEGVAAQKSESKGKIKDVFTVASNRRAILTVMLLRAAQQFSGITALIFYVSTILREVDSSLSVTFSTILFFVTQLIMSIVGSLVVDWAGRRKLLLWSCFGSAMALFPLAIYFQQHQNGADMGNWSFLPLTCLIIYIVFYGFGLQNIPLVMVGELFPTNIKAIACCFGDLYFAALATIVSKFFEITNNNIGAYFPFYVFGGSCLICTVLIYLFVPETKGITLEEIQCLLQSKKKFKKDIEDVEDEASRKTSFMSLNSN